MLCATRKAPACAVTGMNAVTFPPLLGVRRVSAFAFKVGKPYSYFEKSCRKKKHQSARDKTERWSGYSLEFCILAWRKFASLYFCTWKICFSSQGPTSVYFYCRMSLSEENSSKLDIPCFYMSEKKENLKFALILLLHVISIQHVQ